MNPIYRHSFVNAFLVTGAIYHTTGNIEGANKIFSIPVLSFRLMMFIPGNCTKIIRHNPAGLFMIVIKNLSGVGEVQPRRMIRNLTYQMTPHIFDLM